MSAILGTVDLWGMDCFTGKIEGTALRILMLTSIFHIVNYFSLWFFQALLKDLYMETHVFKKPVV